jgi:uncharacterized protein (DUF2147 family)
MKVSKFLAASLSALCGLAFAQYEADGCDIVGQWRTQMHGAKVKISDCSDGSPCGVLVWVNPATRGSVTLDERNADPALRQRPLIGVPILWGYKCKSARLDHGSVYNPETGQTFRSSIRKVAPHQLHVTGCLGPLCLTEVWTRVENE